jgi:hypothetical protein
MIKELDEFVSISSSCLVKSYVSEDLLCEQNLALDLFFCATKDWTYLQFCIQLPMLFEGALV